MIDPLVGTYYLRTLPWGALTRQWPAQYSVWQEDADAEGGYRLIKTMDRCKCAMHACIRHGCMIFFIVHFALILAVIKTLSTAVPSNPEVEDIKYDIENGVMEERKSGGVLDQFGDFVNGMMRL